MNYVCWIAGIGALVAVLLVSYIIAKKTRATQGEYFLVYMYVLLLSFVLVVLLWLMLSGISTNYNK